MSNIHQFPEGARVQKRLDDLKEELADLYDNLNRGYELMDRLEDKVREREAWYNEVLERYANAVGMEHIEVGYLEYATKNVAIDLEGTEITFKWEPENDDETDL